jgi:hypothetical protein
VPGKSSPRKVSPTNRARDAQAVELKTLGMSWQEVADKLGWQTASAARRAALRCLDRVEADNATTLRRLEASHLDRIQRMLLGKIANASTKDTVAIANSLINLSARRSRMLGLDRPFELEVSKGASDAEFAVVAEALLKRAGREVPNHIALNAADARRQGILPPAALVEAAVVVDAEVVVEPEPLPEVTPAHVADLATPEAVESLDTALVVGNPAWTDDGEIIAPFVVDDTDNEAEPTEAEGVPEIVDGEPSGRPVAEMRPQPEPRVKVDGWKLRSDHPLVARPTFQSGIDSRRLA